MRERDREREKKRERGTRQKNKDRDRGSAPVDLSETILTRKYWSEHQAC